MTDELNVTEGLRQQFAQLGQIQTVADRLRSRLDQISAQNHRVAGSDDEYAKAYHKNVDASTQNLSDLVDGIGQLFDTTGTNGQVVDKGFDDVNDAATGTSARRG